MISPDLSKLPGTAKIVTGLFLHQVEQILSECIQGAYITGSVALNDFHPEKSDIDFIITCRRLPNKQEYASLKRLHRQVQKQFPKPDLSGSYIATGDLQAKDIADIPVLSWHEGSLRFQTLEMAPVVLYELKTTAITLFGIDANRLAINIGQKEVNEFMYQNINSYWKKWIAQHSNWFSKKLILFIFPRFSEWVVLGMARMYCTLVTGNIVSKNFAGNFCIDRMPPFFKHILQECLKIRNDSRTYPIVRSYAIHPSLKRTKATISFARFLLAEFNETYLLNKKVSGT